MHILVRGLVVLVVALSGTAVVAGTVAAAWVGPDDTVTIRTQEITTTGPVISTAPGALSLFGPTLRIRAEAVAPATDLWLGVAHQSDLDSYYGDLIRDEVTEVAWPGRLRSHAVDGVRQDLVAPGSRDWWVAQDGGASPSLEWRMPDGDYGVALMRTAGSCWVPE